VLGSADGDDVVGIAVDAGVCRAISSDIGWIVFSRDDRIVYADRVGGELDPRLAEAVRRARASLAEVTIAEETFASYLVEHAPAGLELDRMHVSDLYLACGCALREPAALRLFDERFIARVPIYLARLGADGELVEETRQTLRARLLVASEESPARITQYNGQGALDSWVRVAAVRVALNLIEGRRRHVAAALPNEDLLPAGGDPELDYLRDHYRAAFAIALKRAVTELSGGERALLRFHFVDGLTPGHIGGIYGVHRTTTLRRIATAKQILLERTRAHVISELRISPSECDSLMRLVRSHLPVTLSSLFGSRAKP
jgi:RNA polymerase sigma-70 factor, ECF subfamily